MQFAYIVRPPDAHLAAAVLRTHATPGLACQALDSRHDSPSHRRPQRFADQMLGRLL
jgi:hypothetical protein